MKGNFEIFAYFNCAKKRDMQKIYFFGEIQIFLFQFHMPPFFNITWFQKNGISICNVAEWKKDVSEINYFLNVIVNFLGFFLRFQFPHASVEKFYNRSVN